MSEIDCEYKTYITCPHCGYEDRDSWETDFGNSLEAETDVFCGGCEEEFTVARQAQITYSSRKREQQ
jgi:transcription elongation factor Elf1